MLNASASINGFLEHNTVENLDGMPSAFSKANSIRKIFVILKLFDHIKILSSWYNMLPFCYEFREYILIAQCEFHKRIKCLNIIFNAHQLISFFPADISKKSAKNTLENCKYSNNEHLIQCFVDN